MNRGDGSSLPACLQSPSPKLKTESCCENQFWHPGFTNGVRQFCGYYYFFLWNIILFSSFIFSIFFKSLKSIFTQMLRPQKGNSGVSFNDTLLNFGLWSLPQFNLQLYKWGYLPYYCPYKGVKGTVVSRTCFSINGRSLKITL